MTVPVAVEERAARAPPARLHPRRRRDVGEGPVPVVVEEEVGAEVRDVEIQAPVLVEIAGADAVAPGRGVHSRLVGDVLELPVPEVAVEGIGVGNALPPLVELERAHGIDVEEAVVVVVDEGDPAAAGLQEMVFRASATERLLGETSYLLELDGRRLSLHARRLRRGPHRGGVTSIRRLRHLGLGVAALEGKDRRRSGGGRGGSRRLRWRRQAEGRRQRDDQRETADGRRHATACRP